MTLTTSPATAHAVSAASFDALAPLRLPPDLRLTPEQFELVCTENREAVLELAADGRVIAMTPTGSETSGRNSELLFQLQQFAKASGSWKVFESSGGFQLPDGSVVSPDGSLVSLDRWQALTANERRSFAPLCPDLVVELASPAGQWRQAGLVAVAPTCRPWRCGPPAAHRNASTPLTCSMLALRSRGCSCT